MREVFVFEGEEEYECPHCNRVIMDWTGDIESEIESCPLFCNEEFRLIVE